MQIQESVVNEIVRRFEILNNQPIEELRSRILTSRIRFNMDLALIGYPFDDPPEWMDQDYLKSVIDEDTFHSNLYDSIIDNLHSQLIEKITQDEIND